MPDTLPTHDRPEIRAVLGPTNTGKTHYAIERMLRHRSGVMGLPLRLLAREVYDRVAARRGAGAVALVTGEEKIEPFHARYRVATTEAMSSMQGADFVAVDEIQVAADPERGHVFTDRLLRARGYRETLFLGSASMENRIRQLVPEARISGRERLSRLSYGGRVRLDSLPPRTAIVAFSAAEVYEIASIVRRRRGGAAVVLGALSPRTRNSQVELFQSGEVDTIVATDAIGMGLNLDIDVVAFTRLSKFDGERMRGLRPEEIGQIAGRAGRHRRPGSFVVVDWEEELPPSVARAIVEQQFPPVPVLRWRNPDPDFSSAPALLDSLLVRPKRPGLTRPRDGSDLRTLQILVQDRSVLERASGPRQVGRLWDACRIPDYPAISADRHAALVREVFLALTSGQGSLTDDWMAALLRRINTRTEDIDALAASLEHARTCQYIANQDRWLPDPEHWRQSTRAVEDEISDNLHRRLVDLFVDSRATRIARLARQGRKPVANVEEDGTVAVEGTVVGRLDGFQFRPERPDGTTATDAEVRAAKAAARTAVSARVQAFLAADATGVAPQLRKLLWRGQEVATVLRGDDPLRPQLQITIAEFADPQERQRAQDRLQNHLDAILRRDFAPLLALRDDPRLTPAARGIAYRLVESFGILQRGPVAAEIRALPQEERKLLRAHGVRFGNRHVFLPALLKPAPTRLRLSLWSLGRDPSEVARLPEPPGDGLVNVPVAPDFPAEFLRMCGYCRCGSRAVRIDMLERLLDMVYAQEKVGEWFDGTLDMLSITGSSADVLREIMDGLGYDAEPATEPSDSPAEAEPTATPDADGAPTAQESPGAPDAADAEPAPQTPPGDGAIPDPEPARGAGYRFRRRPKPKRPPRPRRSRQEPEREASETGPDARKPRRPTKRREGGKRSAKADDRSRRERRSAPSTARKPEIDPNSPFAVLAKLKFGKDPESTDD